MLLHKYNLARELLTKQVNNNCCHQSLTSIEAATLLIDIVAKQRYGTVFLTQKILTSLNRVMQMWNIQLYMVFIMNVIIEVWFKIIVMVHLYYLRLGLSLRSRNIPRDCVHNNTVSLLYVIIKVQVRICKHILYTYIIFYTYLFLPPSSICEHYVT